jgi:hypothetical protein
MKGTVEKETREHSAREVQGKSEKGQVLDPLINVRFHCDRSVGLTTK